MRALSFIPTLLVRLIVPPGKTGSSHRAPSFRDRPLDLLRCRRAPLREVPDLGGDDGEAAAQLARSRRFHRGIERQPVGLERDRGRRPAPLRALRRLASAGGPQLGWSRADDESRRQRRGDEADEQRRRRLRRPETLCSVRAPISCCRSLSRASAATAFASRWRIPAGGVVISPGEASAGDPRIRRSRFSAMYGPPLARQRASGSGYTALRLALFGRTGEAYDEFEGSRGPRERRSYAAISAGRCRPAGPRRRP